MITEKELFYRQTWYCDGFALEIPVAQSQLNKVSDIILTSPDKHPQKINAILQFKDGHQALLKPQHIDAHCHTLCPEQGEKDHPMQPPKVALLSGQCYPSGQRIYCQHYPAKDERIANSLFVHYLECSLSGIYQQLLNENPDNMQFSFKHCPIISVVLQAKPKPIFNLKAPRFFR